MKVLLTGSNGLLGSEVYKYFVRNNISVQKFQRTSIKKFDFDLKLLSTFDCIIHTAANTNVEQCEKDPESCYKDNTLFTERLAIACQIANAKLVFISSVGIYGSEKFNTPYHEYDRVNPTTHHHNAKWLGEQAVSHYCKNSLILRVGWLFGGEISNPKNFVARRIEEALNAEDKSISSNNEQLGVPTYVNDVVKMMHKLILSQQVGTFNLVNSGIATRYEYVSKIVLYAGLDVKVLPISQKHFNRIAKVSNNESAVNLKLEQLGYEKLPNWQKSLEEYIQSILIHIIKHDNLNG